MIVMVVRNLSLLGFLGYGKVFGFCNESSRYNFNPETSAELSKIKSMDDRFKIKSDLNS